MYFIALLINLIPEVNNLEIIEYYRSADLFSQGQLPYADFYWEYPPGFLWVLSLFRLMTGDIAVFRLIWFGFLCLCLLGLIIMYLNFLSHKVKTLSPRLVPMIITVMIILVFTVNKAFVNPDVFVSLLLLIAFVIKDKSKAYWLSFLLGWTAAIRIYPVLFFGLILLKKTNWKTKFWQIGLFSIPWLLIFIYLGGWPVIIGFAPSFIAQMSRAVQIESISGLIMLIFHWLGSEVYTKVQPEYMSINLYFRQIPLAWSLINLIKWVPLAVTFYLILRNKQDIFSEKWLFYQFCLLLIISLLIVHSVLSPQYLIWLWIPWGLWLLEGYLEQTILKLQLIINVLVMLLIHILTTVYLTYYSVDKVILLLNLDPTALLPIEVRNLLIVLLWLMILNNLIKNTPRWRQAKPK